MKLWKVELAVQVAWYAFQLLLLVAAVVALLVLAGWLKLSILNMAR